LASSNRSQIAVESNVLMRRAAWCGAVFALAVILTFLNFMPPVDVQYHVRSKVVVSETRLAQLREIAVADRDAFKRGVTKPIQLMSVKVLDLAEQEHSIDFAPTQEKVVLIEVGTLWSSRCTSERHFTWLKNISTIDSSRLIKASTAQSARFARWELAAAKHYQSQFVYLSEKSPLPTDVAVDHAVEEVKDAQATGHRKSFQLASYSEPATLDAAEGELLPEDFAAQLNEQLTLAQERVAQSEKAWQAELEQSSGTLQIASVPVVAPRSTSIPFWMAASIIVLGLAAGSTAGWFQYRGHSGGTYHARYVAEQLALDSLPIAGRLVLSKSEHQTTIASNGPTNVVRAGLGLTRLAEYALTFWVVIAVGRFFLDSVWRDVLVNSPLAALGRMLAGMP
jgi:hypothetical protein